MLHYHNNLIIQKNCLPARAYYEIENVPKQIFSDWKFSYFSEWDDSLFLIEPTNKVKVPFCWQILGYDSNQYTNYKYPFPYDPPYINKPNPCGIYSCKYIIKDKKGKYYLNFDGVDSCFYVFINNEFVGYSSVSHCHSEFDITKYLETDNEIKVIVFKWNWGSYLEDQDKFRMSGIFRDVYILNRDEGHLFDFEIKTDYKNNKGIISFDCDKICQISIFFKKKLIEKKQGSKIIFEIENPNLWSAEIPNLYRLEIKCNGEYIIENIGIRKIEVKNNVMLLNGKPIKFKGVNRHSFTVNGYCESKEDIINDIKMLKEGNVNAVRTSHYPPHPLFTKLCDEYGIYIIEESDIECHGVVSQNGDYDINKFDELAQNSLFKEQFINRIIRMYQRDKNRQCILIWSLGNESGWGENFIVIGNILKKLDNNRLLHYEGTWDKLTGTYKKENILDIYSIMYPEIDWMNEFVKNCDRPLLLCEYSHAMGNSCGDLKDYWQSINNHKEICGAFIWEFCSQSIIKNDKILYGGDFNDYPNDDNFCIDGLVTTNRIPNPSYYEMKEVYAPIDIVFDGLKYIIKNKYDFKSFDDIDCTYEIICNDKIISSGILLLKGIEAGKNKEFDINIPKTNGYTYLNFIFKDNEIEIAKRQFCLNDTLLPVKKIIEGNTIQEKYDIDYSFDKKGLLCNYKVHGIELLAGKIKPIIMRAPIDNDIFIKQDWEKYGANKAKFGFIKKEIGDKICVLGKIGADSLRPIADLNITYIPKNNGTININCSVDVKDGIKSLPRFGFSIELNPVLNEIVFFGRGLNEAYVDRKMSAPIGLYKINFKKMNYYYSKPQESGSHCDSKFVIIKNKNLGIMIDSIKDFSFQLTPYSLEDYKPHSFEMIKSKKLYLNIDYMMSGIGSNSCGPKLNEKYLLTQKHFEFNFNIKAYCGENVFEKNREI